MLLLFQAFKVFVVFNDTINFEIVLSFSTFVSLKLYIKKKKVEVFRSQCYL